MHLYIATSLYCDRRKMVADLPTEVWVLTNNPNKEQVMHIRYNHENIEKTTCSDQKQNL